MFVFVYVFETQARIMVDTPKMPMGVARGMEVSSWSPTLLSLLPVSGVFLDWRADLVFALLTEAANSAGTTGRPFIRLCQTCELSFMGLDTRLSRIRLTVEAPEPPTHDMPTVGWHWYSGCLMSDKLPHL